MRRANTWRVAARGVRSRLTTAIALGILSAVGIAACAFAPIFLQSVTQAQLRHSLLEASISGRGLALTSASAQSQPLSELPTEVERKLYADPVTSLQATVTYSVGTRHVRGPIVERSGACAHLQLASGRCPTAAGEAMASTSAARALGLQVGQVLSATVVAQVSDLQPLSERIVGLFEPIDADTDYWFGHQYSSAVGAYETGRDNIVYLADALLVGPGLAPRLNSPTASAPAQVPVANSVELALRVDRVELGDMARLRRGIEQSGSPTVAADARIDTELPSILDEVDAGHRQAADVIPGFAVELALLILVVTALVVAAAADQRRPDFALARLRGRNRQGAAAMLTREFAPILVLSALPGLAGAWLLARLANELWLEGTARPGLGWSSLLAGLAVLVIELLIVLVVARRTAGLGVHDLLRRVPTSAPGRLAGLAEVAIGALAIGGVVGLRTGGEHNLLAVLTPGLIALVVGLILSRLVVVLARRLGRRALWRGRTAAGLAALQFARRPGMRRVVTLLGVAAALIVSAADQSSVADRNRAVRAGFEVGAPVVLSVRADDPLALAAAVAASDPSRHFASPVVTQSPPGGGIAVTAVDPASFSSVAAWGWAKDRPPTDALSGLRPTLPPPVAVTGTSMRLSITAGTAKRITSTNTPGTPSPVYVLVGILPIGGAPQAVRFGPLPETPGRPFTLSLDAAIACTRGCEVTSLSVLRATVDSDFVELRLPFTLTAGTGTALTPVDLGASADWARSTPEVAGVDGPVQTAGLSATGTAGVFTASSGSNPTAVQQLNQPLAIPAVVAGHVETSTNEAGFLDGPNIDGLSASFRQVGRVAQIPGPGGPGFIVDLTTASRLATGSTATSTFAVWLADDTPGPERTFVAALAQHGVAVTGRATARSQQSDYDESAPAWALKLAWITAIIAALIAILVLIITAATTARTRAYDLAAMRQLGSSWRTTLLATVYEQVAGVFVAGLAGAIVGVIGAQLALPSLPIFITPVSPPAVLHPLAWPAILISGGGFVVLLVMTAVGVAREFVARATPDRLREVA